MAVTLRWSTGYVEGNSQTLPEAPTAGDIIVVAGTARSNGSFVIPVGWTGRSITPPSGNPSVLAWKVATGSEGTSWGLGALGFTNGGGGFTYVVCGFTGFTSPTREGTGAVLNPGSASSPDTCVAMTPGTAAEIVLLCLYAVEDPFQAGDCTVSGGGFTQIAAGHIAGLGDPFWVAGYRVVASPSGAYAMVITHRNGGAAGASAIEGVYSGAGGGGGGSGVRAQAIIIV